ncbi:MAG TPA: endo-1,4-beta-xylanase [Methylomirabilota bacterium]|nr:endo-1,4-beta-xylanase [Methylomirabilota bacterium]
MAAYLSRRDTLMVIASLMACAGFARSVALAGERAPSLAEAADRAGILFGASVAQDMVDDPGLTALYRRHAGVFTADWALKFDTLRPDAGVFDTSYAEAVIGAADDAGVPIRGHTLAWNESRPDWLMRSSAKEKRIALDRHIDETAGAFAGRVVSWDVVNEPFWPGHGLPGAYRDGPWYEAFGPDYVERAFRRAAAADPAARLILNEAHTEQWTPTGAAIRAGLLDLVDRLQDAGVRLDAVGLQGHMQPQWAYDDGGFADFLHQLAARKVEIHITELDVNDDAYPDDPLIRDAAVAERYERFLDAVLAVPAVTTVICWQLADGASHYASLWRDAHPNAERRPRPLPFDEALQPKAAYRAMMAAFERRASRAG